MVGTKDAGSAKGIQCCESALSSGPVPFVLFKGAGPTRAHKAGLLCQLNDVVWAFTMSFSCLVSFMSYDAGTLFHFPIS